MTTLNDHLFHLTTFADNFITHWMEDDGNDAEDKACCARAHEANKAAEAALLASLDASRAMLAALNDVELLVRVNAPINDGSPMHRTVLAVIAQAKEAGLWT